MQISSFGISTFTPAFIFGRMWMCCVTAVQQFKKLCRKHKPGVRSRTLLRYFWIVDKTLHSKKHGGGGCSIFWRVTKLSLRLQRFLFYIGCLSLRVFTVWGVIFTTASRNSSPSFLLGGLDEGCMTLGKHVKHEKHVEWWWYNKTVNTKTPNNRGLNASWFWLAANVDSREWADYSNIQKGIIIFWQYSVKYEKMVH